LIFLAKPRFLLGVVVCALVRGCGRSHVSDPLGGDHVSFRHLECNPGSTSSSSIIIAATVVAAAAAAAAAAALKVAVVC
jgi:hypothetical protein